MVSGDGHTIARKVGAGDATVEHRGDKARFGLNVAAGVVGRSWSALMALAFVPLYLRLLGVEAYGLIAFYTTLQTSFAVIDLGLTTTLSRELSIRAATAPHLQKQVLRTLEAIYWLLALAGALFIVAGSGLIATNWIQADRLTDRQVQKTTALMGVVLAFQWPLGFYLGGLVGLQRQVLQNILLIGTSTLRYGGAAFVLASLSPTLDAFFLWQLAINAIGALAAGLLVWAALRGSAGGAGFSVAVLKEVWRFTAGMAAISAAALLWSQIDRILLSRLLSLEAFAQYSLAALAASSLYVLIVPVSATVLPALSRSVAARDSEATSRFYHLGAQFAAVLMMPLACILVAFAPHILMLWTRDPEISTRMARALRYLTVGVALQGVVNVAYMLQLAHGWTRLMLVSHLLALAVSVPAIIAFAPVYGPEAAAMTWLVVNVAYFTLHIPVLHTRLLRGHLKRWYIHDVGAPTIAAALVVGIVAGVVPSDLSPLPMIAVLLGTALLSSAAAVLTASAVRQRLFVIK